jgi:hypothetical protein
MPVARAILCFAAVMPIALFSENETPGIPYFLRFAIFVSNLLAE